MCKWRQDDTAIELTLRNLSQLWTLRSVVLWSNGPSIRSIPKMTSTTALLQTSKHHGNSNNSTMVQQQQASTTTSKTQHVLLCTTQCDRQDYSALSPQQNTLFPLIDFSRPATFPKHIHSIPHQNNSMYHYRASKDVRFRVVISKLYKYIGTW